MRSVRRREHFMPKDIPKRVFAVVVFCALIAFFLGLYIARFLSDMVAPYLVFGVEAARQGIKVTGGDGRHTIEFSNGAMIHGLKILPVLGVWAFLCAVFMLGLWFIFLRIAARLVRRRDAGFADDVVHFWKFER